MARITRGFGSARLASRFISAMVGGGSMETWKRRPSSGPFSFTRFRTLGGRSVTSHVTDGKITYCGDSTHGYAGQTLELPDFARGLGGAES